HRVVLARDRDGPVAQRDAHRQRALDLAQVGVVLAQERNGLDVLDRQFSNDHRTHPWDLRNTKLLTMEVPMRTRSRAWAGEAKTSVVSINPMGSSSFSPVA